MAEISQRLATAVKKRSQYILENLSTLTMKQFRSVLEQDLGMAPKSLKAHKSKVDSLVDQIVLENSGKDTGEALGDEEQLTPSKKGKKERVKEKANATKSEQKTSQDKKKRKAKSEEPKAAKKPAKPVKKANTEKNKPAPTGSKQHSKRVEKMKDICKKAGITVPVSIYKNKVDTELEAAFAALLEKYDLTPQSGKADIADARSKIQKQKDLEGIDLSNIVAGGRRSRQQVDYRKVMKYEGLSDDESDSGEQDDQDESAESSAPESDEENVPPKNGNSHKRKRQQSDEDQASEDAESGDEDVGKEDDGSNEEEQGSDADADENDDDDGKEQPRPKKGKSAKKPKGTHTEEKSLHTKQRERASTRSPKSTVEKRKGSGEDGTKVHDEAQDSEERRETSDNEPVVRRVVADWSDDDE